MCSAVCTLRCDHIGADEVGALGLSTHGVIRVSAKQSPIEICLRFAIFSAETFGFCALM